jgi:hypothetical protein
MASVNPGSVIGYLSSSYWTELDRRNRPCWVISPHGLAQLVTKPPTASRAGRGRPSSVANFRRAGQTQLRHLPPPAAPLMITSQHPATKHDPTPQNDLGTAVWLDPGIDIAHFTNISDPDAGAARL